MILKKLVQWIDRIMAIVLEGLMAFMVLDVTWQVLSRFAIRHPSPYTEEIARFLLIWIGLLGASYAYRQMMHLGVDVLVQKLSGNNRLWADAVVHSFVLLFAAFVMVWGGFRLVLLTLELDQISAALQIKMGYVYLVIPLSGLLISFYAILFLRDIFIRFQGSGEPIMETEEKIIAVE